MSGVVEVKRVDVVRGKHCGVGYGKYKCVASENESVEDATASRGSEEVVNWGSLLDAMLVRRSERASGWDMAGSEGRVALSFLSRRAGPG